MTTWFTADTHFNHNNIRFYCGRPFETVEQMNNTMITNWNAVIQPRDVVYHIGDFGFGNVHYLNGLAQKLHGTINIILGNHDKEVKKDPLCNRFGFIKDMHILKTKHDNKTYELFLFHYACRTWYKSNHGCIHLFGHSHGKMPPYGLSMDVGVDTNNFFPYSLEQILQKMNTFSPKLDYDPNYNGKTYQEIPQVKEEDA